jgi:hypothetical protein
MMVGDGESFFYSSSGLDHNQGMRATRAQRQEEREHENAIDELVSDVDEFQTTENQVVSLAIDNGLTRSFCILFQFAKRSSCARLTCSSSVTCTRENNSAHCSTFSFVNIMIENDKNLSPRSTQEVVSIGVDS